MSKYDGSTIQYCSVEKIPLDLECFHDIATGNGIRLTSVESFDKRHQKIYHGLQSEFFGTDFSSDSAFKERYRCKCGKYMGKAYSGMKCDVCHGFVEYHDIDLNKTGWVISDKFWLISPIYSAKLREALGSFEGEKVIRLIATRHFEEDGKPELSEKEQYIVSKHPFSFKGLIWLHEHMGEVLNYYRRRKPSKQALFDELEAEQDMMWTHCLPIYTSLLRTELPGEKGSKNFKLKINTSFKSIIKTINVINDALHDELDYRALNSIDILLASVQKEIDKVFDVTYSDLTSKTGVITSKVLGGRYNFSSRSVIVPDSGTLRSDEVIIGYIPFLELFRYELINEYQKIKGCTPGQANSAWKTATNRFDDEFYSIIQHMLSNPEYYQRLIVIINRNPSINYGSFQCVRIVGVTKDINNKVLQIPTQIITPMNADFDGDLINVFRVIGLDFQKRFGKNLNPRYNLFVSRMDGKVNKETIPIRDELIAFGQFAML